MEDKNVIKKPRERSSSYPSTGLEKAVSLIKQVRKALGRASYDRITLARALGYSGISGASTRTVAALVHYGLLDRKGDTYTPSLLSDKIVNSLNQTEFEQALIEAAKTPKLFAALIEEFAGQELPERLDAVLARRYGIAEKFSREAAETFRITMEYVGLLRNGRFVTESPTGANEANDAGASEKNRIEQVATATKGISGSGITITTPSGIEILFPGKYGYKLATRHFADWIEQLDKLTELEDQASREENEPASGE